MRSRQEQVQAHRFITRRIVSGLLSGEPETNDLPMRRFGLAMFGSVMVAAIVFAIVGVIGLVNPGGGKPTGGELIIMRETGARYVLVEQTLHPVLNWTSALLFAGTEKPSIRQMSRDSLSAYSVGEPIGIPGAPDPPPDRNALLGLPWSVCGTPPRGAGAPTTMVFVGREPAGGAALGTDSALLLSTLADDSGPAATYLVLGDRRYRVVDETTLTALELAAITPVVVGKALLNAISGGPDLRQPRIDGAGETSSREVGGDRGEIGQVYRAGQQRYVLTREGLVTIGEVSAKLLLADDPQGDRDLGLRRRGRAGAGHFGRAERLPVHVAGDPARAGRRPAAVRGAQRQRGRWRHRAGASLRGGSRHSPAPPPPPVRDGMAWVWPTG